jgi:hypothetical protein
MHHVTRSKTARPGNAKAQQQITNSNRFDLLCDMCALNSSILLVCELLLVVSIAQRNMRDQLNEAQQRPHGFTGSIVFCESGRISA